jgi:hypothetical protein
MDTSCRTEASAVVEFGVQDRYGNAGDPVAAGTERYVVVVLSLPLERTQHRRPGSR